MTNTRAASNYNMEAVGSSGAKTIIRRNRTLLIGGRKDGQICVINWDTGKPDFIIEVTNVFSNSDLVVVIMHLLEGF